MTDEWPVLVEHYLHGTLTVEEEAVLLGQIERNPHLARMLQEAVYYESLLVDMGLANGNVPNDVDFLAALGESFKENGSAGHALSNDVSPISQPVFSSFAKQNSWRTLRRAGNIACTITIVFALGIIVGYNWFRPNPIIQNIAIVSNGPESSLSNNSSNNSFPEQNILFPSSLNEDRSDNELPKQQEAMSRSVAVAKLVSNPVWGDDSEMQLKNGTTISPGRLILDSGLVVIEFFSGVRLVVEGPVDLEILSNNRAFCHRGHLKADVPKQAIGFRIDTDRTNVVDLGTSFQMDVSENDTMINVLDGLVELHDLPSGVRQLKEGDAVLVSDGGELEFLEEENPFALKEDVSPQLLNIIQAGQQQQLSAKWKKQGELLNNDPSLLVRFDFREENITDRTIANMARFGRERIPYGVMIQCNIADGQWDKKDAIEFRKIADRFRFDIPGEYRAMTLATHIRIDSLERMFNSIFTTDGFSPGELHWHLLWKKDMELGVYYSPDKPHKNIHSPKNTITPEMIGRWIHLAVTIDIDAGKASLYLDGKRVHRESGLKMDIPLKLGNVQLGNWTTKPGVDVHPIRHFTGAMDDFLIFDRALTSEEIGMLNDGNWHENP